jgi:hypothetical protein
VHGAGGERQGAGAEGGERQGRVRVREIGDRQTSARRSGEIRSRTARGNPVAVSGPFHSITSARRFLMTAGRPDVPILKKPDVRVLFGRSLVFRVSYSIKARQGVVQGHLQWMRHLAHQLPGDLLQRTVLPSAPKFPST